MDRCTERSTSLFPIIRRADLNPIAGRAVCHVDGDNGRAFVRRLAAADAPEHGIRVHHTYNGVAELGQQRMAGLQAEALAENYHLGAFGSNLLMKAFR
ncbi:MAG: hypothetical protein K9L70_04440 [Thiohalocapsa sp.]|nr:hypothetical protein [Thiohalocapsa sp.]MCF7992523.1 hypothetical protein [Thiohalocapsa sp.]